MEANCCTVSLNQYIDDSLIAFSARLGACHFMRAGQWACGEDGCIFNPSVLSIRKALVPLEYVWVSSGVLFPYYRLRLI